MLDELLEKRILDFFDDKLTPQNETSLFAELMRNNEARVFFKNAAALRAIVRSTKEKFPEELDAAIYGAIERKTKRPEIKKRLHSLAIYAFAAALLLIGILTFSLINKYENDISELKRIAQFQRNTIEMLVNDSPEIQVKEELTGKIIIQNNL